MVGVTLVIAVIFLIPVFFALISAFKTNGEIIANPVALPTSLNLDNFVQLFKKADVWGALRNTLILTVVSELLIVVVVPMGAYGIQRTGNKWLKKCYTFFMVGMMIPFHVYMFSLFREMQAFGIYKTMIGPIVCYISGSVPFGTLMYFNFLKGIPVEIEEAATIDGCSPMRTFWQVVFPLLGPCTASMVVLNGLGIWNDFLMPYLVLLRGPVLHPVEHCLCGHHLRHYPGTDCILQSAKIFCKRNYLRRSKGLMTRQAGRYPA